MKAIFFSVAAVLLVAFRLLAWISGVAVPVLFVTWIVGLTAGALIVSAAVAWFCSWLIIVGLVVAFQTFSE
jgi:hypothetical protein